MNHRGAKLALTEDQIKEFDRLRRKGVCRTDLAKLYGISTHTVTRYSKTLQHRRVFKSLSVKKHRPLSPDQVPTLKDWVLSNHIILDGQPLTFAKHEYLVEPYTLDHPYTVDEKAVQMGNTSHAMLRMLYRAKFRQYRGIIYYFPSKSEIIEFSKGRVGPLIDENPDSIGENIKDTDSANIKRIWDTILYLKGMKTVLAVKNTPADFIIFDEMDEAEEKKLGMALKRLSHSEYKEICMLSNPTLPDYGIDRAFQSTDMRYWLLKCPKCNQYTCLEDTFPDCLAEVGNNGGRKVIRLCQSCKDGELNPAIGKWVAKRPEIKEKIGHHYSQLFSQFVSPREILDEFRSTSHMKDFYNLTLGLPYVDSQNRLTMKEVTDLCGDYGIAENDPGPCSMGVDQGKHLHVVIGKKGEPKDKIVHVWVYNEWEELTPLMKRFNVGRCVVDAQPEIHPARKFASAHKGRVFLNFYREFQKGRYKWDEKNFTVACNRTESLDASTQEIQNERVVLPRGDTDIIKEFALHLHNVGKDIEEDKKSGSKRFIYKKLGEDHFRHAFNYEVMARQDMGDLFFPELQ